MSKHINKKRREEGVICKKKKMKRKFSRKVKGLYFDHEMKHSIVELSTLLQGNTQMRKKPLRLVRNHKRPSETKESRERTKVKPSRVLM